MHTSTLWRKCLLATIAAAILFSSCKKKKEDEVTPEEESTTAEIAVTRVTISGVRHYYMGAYSSLPKTLDYATMTELGTNATVYSYGEHPYVWDGAALTLTKYNVSNKLEISKSDAVSFANTGVSGLSGPPAFLSETQAYFFILAEGKVVAFNPGKMEITETINVTALPGSSDPNINTNTYYPYVTADKKILLPVNATPGDFSKFPQQAQVAVFNPVTKTVTYTNDPRMSMGYNAFAKNLTTGDFYYRPSKDVVKAEDYAKLTGYPTTGGILKVKADGTFDPTFFLNLEDTLNAHCINSVIYAYDNKAVVQYTEAGYAIPTDPSKWAPSTKMVLMDLTTGKYESFTAIAKYGAVYSIGNVNGQEYYGTFGGSGDAAGKYYFLKQTGAATFEVASEALGGSGIYYAKLR